MPSWSVGRDAAGIALRVWIEPWIVNVAVEHFVPVATARKAEAIAVIVKRALVQARDHDHIAANPRQPTMNSDDTVVVMHMEHIDAFGAQRRMLSPERPSHQINNSGRPGQSVQYLSSRNSCPMKIIGTPGAVSRRPVATLARLRAYQERALLGSASAAMRG